MGSTAPQSLLNNSRFYILAFSVVLSLFLVALSRLLFESDQLFVIRLQQLYGLAAIVFWYLALLISPISHIIGKSRMRHIEFARRAIGVSAFYFTALHGVVALFGQLGGVGELMQLPDFFMIALILGGFAFLFLGIMAATSFYVVVQRMTFKRWKLLHRFVYIAGIVALLHVWMIGTHLAYGGYQLAGFIAIGILIGLELFKLTRVLNRRYFKLARYEAGALFLTTWALGLVLLLSLPTLVPNYHSQHTSHAVENAQ